MVKFSEKLHLIQLDFLAELQINKPIIMTEQDQINFNNATECYICNNSIGPVLDKHQSLGKVRDHCHLAGSYRGASHCVCNLHRNNTYFKIPVFFHNLKRNMMLI